MKLSAIIPVKSFSVAKSRLGLDDKTREQLCKMMLEEVLRTVSVSSAIDSVVVVSRDRQAVDIAEKFDAAVIEDVHEAGVNDAVALADEYLGRNAFDASIVFPQDIPFMKTQDIDFLLQFQRPPSCALVTPSRKFDGTNALLRMPADLMGTHYDEDSYRIHLSAGRQKTENASLVFVRRIMMDIDDGGDLRYCLAQNEKPDFCARVRKLLE